LKTSISILVNPVPEFNRGGNEITRGRGSGGTRRAGAGRARGFGNSQRGRKESSEMRSRSPLNLKREKQDDVSPVKRDTSFSQHEQHSQQNLVDHDTVYDLDHSSMAVANVIALQAMSLFKQNSERDRSYITSSCRRETVA